MTTKQSAPKQPTNGTHDSQFDEWALLELFGHTKICGRVTASAIGGASFVRIDVPEVAGKQGYTRYFSPQAIYSITPMTRETAMSVIKTGLNPEMISRYDVKRMLPAMREEYQETFED